MFKQQLLVHIDGALLAKLNKNHDVLDFPDISGRPQYFWRATLKTQASMRNEDVIRWEKWHVWGDQPIYTSFTPVYTTGAVLLKQGKVDKKYVDTGRPVMVKYRPGIRKAMDAVGIYCLFSAIPRCIYTDVPTELEIHFKDHRVPVVVSQEFGAIPIPPDAELIIETRKEPEGYATKIAFVSKYFLLQKYLAKALNIEIRISDDMDLLL